MEQSREEFERWFIVAAAPSNKLLSWSKTLNAYKYTLTQNAWEIWQASRAAVVVTIPNIIDDAWDDQRVGFNIGIRNCRTAIEAQGLTVK